MSAKYVTILLVGIFLCIIMINDSLFYQETKVHLECKNNRLFSIGGADTVDNV